MLWKTTTMKDIRSAAVARLIALRHAGELSLEQAQARVERVYRLGSRQARRWERTDPESVRYRHLCRLRRPTG